MKKQLIFITMLSILGLSTNAQWQQTSLDSGSVNCFAVSGAKIFIGTEQNGVYLSTNNGTNWTKKNNGLNDSIVKALAINGNNIFAGVYYNFSTNHVLFSTSNDGNNWIVSDSGLPADSIWSTSYGITSVAADGTNIFIGTTNYKGVYLSINNGANWVSTNNGIPSNVDVNSITISGTDIFAVTAGPNGSGVYLSTNNGSNWTAVNNGLPNDWAHPISKIAISGINVFAGTVGYGVYMSVNNGANWSAVNNGLPANIKIRDFAITGTNIFAGTSNGVFLSTNNGTNWLAVNTGLTDTIVQALTIHGDTLLAGTHSAGVWKRSLSQMVGIEEMKNNERSIAIYPNPATNKMTIEAPPLTIIEISNVQGNLIKTIEASENMTTIDISDFSSGVYIIRAQTDNGITTAKFVKE